MATILIVDDRAINRDVLLSVLRHTGHTFLEASNGAEALGIAKRRHPDLVIADILMPRMDGYEFARALRADPELSSCTVVFYTANYAEDEVRRLAQHTGVVHVISKPADPATILSTVEEALAADPPPPAAALPDEAFHHEHLSVLNDKLLRHVMDLEDLSEERQRLLARLVGAQEEERKRIASDIHDDSVQVMTAAGMRLEMLARKIDDPAILAELDVLQKTVRLAIGRLRHMVFQLRPMALDRDGLFAAIEAYLLQESTQSGYRFTVNNRIATEPPPEARVILYRVAQEAFTNIAKHANAKRILVELDESENGYRVRIADDGDGFDVDRVSTDSKIGHIGLPAMRERVSMAGGWWKIESQPGAGTTVEFWVPSRGIAERPAVPVSA